MNHLRLIIINRFLIPEFSGVKFVAWNGNNYDAYFIAAALVVDPDYTIRPYLTRSHALRGMRVLLSADIQSDGSYPKDSPSWEFLDGIAMLGLVGTPLSKFLDNFAPNHKKLVDVIDFEKEEFNYKNKSHCEYAMRDSVGLWHGMVKAQSILLERFNQPLTVTMGGACIKILQANIPKKVSIYPLPDALENIVRSYVMRGGYCYCVKMYHGPVWKYDINQAYAAAMRDSKLPCEGVFHTKSGLSKYARIYVARIEATNLKNKIPFYYRTNINGKIKSVFSTTSINDTWLTSIEIEQLRAEKWDIDIIESYCFESSFNLKDYVDSLELVRTTCDGGPNGPIGTMMKCVGNHSYGKTLEQNEPVSYLISAECPAGYEPVYRDDETDPLDHLYYQFTPPEEQQSKPYHQPHLGAFITAHVRMKLRQIVMLNPDAWLYADTDCVIFNENMTASIDTDAKRYGAWKIEEEDCEYKIIAKKVYYNVKSKKGSSKGMNTKRLTEHDFDEWYEGNEPVQEQIQKNNFMRVMNGSEMFKSQIRSGTKVNKTTDRNNKSN